MDSSVNPVASSMPCSSPLDGPCSARSGDHRIASPDIDQSPVAPSMACATGFTEESMPPSCAESRTPMVPLHAPVREGVRG